MKLNTTTPWVQLLRWVGAIVLFGITLLWLNQALYCYWAAGGPPNEYPEKWIRQGNMFFGLSALWLILGIMLIVLLRKRDKKGSEPAS